MSVMLNGDKGKNKATTIVAAAKKLHVHRVYLSRILNGHMVSRRLTERVRLRFPDLFLRYENKIQSNT